MIASVSSLKPQDLLVVLGVHVLETQRWTYATLAESLGVSASEAHAAAQRAVRSQLVDGSARRVRGRNLLEFLEHGVRYVFPAEPGQLTRGVPTAASAPPLDRIMVHHPAGEVVWAHADGSVTGQAIVPLYPSVPRVALVAPRLHELLALVDALRLGRVRDRQLAMKELRARIESDRG